MPAKRLTLTLRDTLSFLSTPTQSESVMFLTGEFSRVSRVSKRLLHYYDELGLLKPAHIDPNTGYRYYSAKQLPRLNRILALKELGLSLDHITKMLQEQVGDEDIHGMLMLKKAQIQQDLQEDLQRLRQIEVRIEQNRRADDSPDILLKSIPAQPYLSTRTVFPDLPSVMTFIGLMRQQLPSKLDRHTLGEFAAVIYTDDFRMDNNDAEFGYLLKKPVAGPIALTKDYVLYENELPAVQTMATAVQIGGPELAFVALGKMAQWIEANGFSIAGPYREIGIDIADIDNLSQSVVEIQMPVNTQPQETNT